MLVIYKCTILFLFFTCDILYGMKHLIEYLFILNYSQTCDEKYNIPKKNTIYPSIYLPYLQIEYVKINFLKYFQFTQFCFYL